MDTSLTPDEMRRFRAWRMSPSVFSTDQDELIIAFKLGKMLCSPSSRVLKALRGREGVDPDLVRRVEQYVSQVPELAFTGEKPNRLVRIQVS